MKVKFLPLFALIGLAGCSAANPSQVLLDQMTTNMMETYAISAQAADPVVKGDTISAQNKAVIKKMNADVYNELSSLVQSINANKALTTQEVESAESDLKNFQDCFLSIKSYGKPSKGCKEE